MRASTALVRKNFDSPDETRTLFEKGRIEVVALGGLSFQRETLEPGWRWSEHVKPVVGTDSCQKYHVKFIVSGRQHVVMEDGTEDVLGPGDVAVVPPGHYAWVEGDEPQAGRSGAGLALVGWVLGIAAVALGWITLFVL